MSSLSAVEGPRGRPEQPPPGRPRRRRARRPCRRSSAASSRRRRRRAGGRGRPPARPTRGRAARGRASVSAGDADRERVRRRAVVVQQARAAVSSLVRAPPPIVSAASITVTRTPLLARVAAQARPFGPAPTTIASLMPRAVASESSTASGFDGERPLVQPGLALDHVGDVDPALLDQARRRRRRSGSAGAARAPAGTRA